MSVGPDCDQCLADTKEAVQHVTRRIGTFTLLAGSSRAERDSDIAKGTDVHFILQNFLG
jgi:hypothetical protein